MQITQRAVSEAAINMYVMVATTPMTINVHDQLGDCKILQKNVKGVYNSNNKYDVRKYVYMYLDPASMEIMLYTWRYRL